MKIQTNKLLGFIQSLDFNTRSVLIYGPDLSLCEAKADQLKDHLREKYKPIFETYSEEDIRKDPSLLSFQPSLFSGNSNPRVITIYNAKDRFVKTLETLPDSVYDQTLLLFVSDGLSTKAKIVSLHDTANNRAAVGVYDQTPAERKQLIAAVALEKKISLSPQALEYLGSMLSADPRQVKSELEKVALHFWGQEKTLTPQDLEDLITSEIDESLDNFAYLVSEGNLQQLPNALHLLQEQGHTEVTVLRVLSQHFLKMSQVLESIESGNSVVTAIGTLRPPLFFKTKDRFVAMIQKWSFERCLNAITILKELEMWSKSGSGLVTEYILRKFLSLSQLARRRS